MCDSDALVVQIFKPPQNFMPDITTTGIILTTGYCECIAMKQEFITELQNFLQQNFSWQCCCMHDFSMVFA